MLQRLGLQFSHHLTPLVRVDVAELAAPAVALAAGFFALLWWRAMRSDGGAPPSTAPGPAATVVGFCYAALAYAAFVPAAAFVNPVRTQILAAPGIAVALTGVAYLMARRLSPRAGMLLIGAFGAWVVAVGTGRTLALQRDWDRHGRFPAQRAVLSELVSLAPDVTPHTVFVLLDPSQAFPAVFPFRHAVEYMYARRASGLAWGVPDLFYPYSFGAAGLRVEPAEALREPWQESPTTYRFDEIVVVSRERDGLRLLDAWPPVLPALPAGARYEPRARIVFRDPRLASRSLLRYP
jgi:hypothetical protein